MIKKRKKVSVQVKHAELSMIHAYEELRVIRTTMEEEDKLDCKANEADRELRDIEAKVCNLIKLSNL